MPLPKPTTTLASSSSAAASAVGLPRRDAHAIGRRRRRQTNHLGAAARPAASPAASMPGRTVAISGCVRDAISATTLPPKAGLCCSTRPSASRVRSMHSPVRPRSSRAATRGATSRPKTVDGRMTRPGRCAVITSVSSAANASVPALCASSSAKQDAIGAVRGEGVDVPPRRRRRRPGPRPIHRAAAPARRPCAAARTSPAALRSAAPGRPSSSVSGDDEHIARAGAIARSSARRRPAAALRDATVHSPKSPCASSRSTRTSTAASGVSASIIWRRRCSSTTSRPSTQVGDPATPTRRGSTARSAALTVSIGFAERRCALRLGREALRRQILGGGDERGQRRRHDLRRRRRSRVRR